MYAAYRATWSKAPFTLLSITADMIGLYFSNDKNKWQGKHWFEVCKSSNAWKKQHESIYESLKKLPMYHPPPKKPPELDLDLDKNSTCFIIVNEGSQLGIYAKLMNKLLRHLADRLPSIAIKTGFSHKRIIGDKHPSSLEVAADTCQSGTPSKLTAPAQNRPTDAPRRTRPPHDRPACACACCTHCGRVREPLSWFARAHSSAPRRAEA